MKMHDPVAKLAGKDGNILFLDDNGRIFLRYGININIPLIIYGNAKIQPGMMLNDNLRKVMDTIVILKEKSKNTYEGLGQIEIIDKNNGFCDFIVNYRTNNNIFYLKNDINVDLIKEGFVCSLYLKEEGLDNKSLTYTRNGFVF